MIKKLIGLTQILALAAGPCFSETLVAKRTIRSHSPLSADDFETTDDDVSGGVQSFSQVQGLESRRVLYKGRPLLIADVGPAAVIERNDFVTLVFTRGSLVISTEARALDRAGVGDLVKVMNLGSRNTVTGIVDENGRVVVGHLTAAYEN